MILKYIKKNLAGRNSKKDVNPTINARAARKDLAEAVEASKLERARRVAINDTIEGLLDAALIGKN